MIKRHVLLFYPLFLFASFNSQQAIAASFDVNVHSDALRLTIAKGMARKQAMDFGALLADKNKKHDDLTVLHLGYHWLGDSFRIGFRSIYASPGTTDVLALGIGVQAQTGIARNVFLGGHFYYAPSALSFLDADGYDEFAIRFLLKMGRSAYAYLGYRNFDIRFAPNSGDYEVDDSFHIGLKLYF